MFLNINLNSANSPGSFKRAAGKGMQEGEYRPRFTFSIMFSQLANLSPGRLLLLLARVSPPCPTAARHTGNPHPCNPSPRPPLNCSNLALLAQAQADSSFGSPGFTLQKEEHADEIKIKTAEHSGGSPFLEGSRPPAGMCALSLSCPSGGRGAFVDKRQEPRSLSGLKSVN